jgi:hypothetical protein
MIFENHHYDITSCILKCSFEIINDLGTGFLESVYKNSLYPSKLNMMFFIKVKKLACIMLI